MIVSLTHKSTHVANEAEEAALWGICSRLAEGRGEDSEAGVPMALYTPPTPPEGALSVLGPSECLADLRFLAEACSWSKS